MFSDSIGELTLIPGEKGRFEVTVDGDLVYSKATIRPTRWVLCVPEHSPVKAVAAKLR